LGGKQHGQLREFSLVGWLDVQHLYFLGCVISIVRHCTPGDNFNFVRTAKRVVFDVMHTVKWIIREAVDETQELTFLGV
jgi:hypothetical protein